jgi:hypothetical protein
VHQSDEINREWNVKETRLVSIDKSTSGALPSNYPRAELIVEKK